MNMNLPKVKELYLEANNIVEANGGLTNLDYATSCIGLAAYFMDLDEYENAEQSLYRGFGNTGKEDR